MLRWARRIAIFLLLGAIVNVAVVIAIVLAHGEVHRAPRTLRLGDSDSQINVDVRSGFGYEFVAPMDLSDPLFYAYTDDTVSGTYPGRTWWPSGRAWMGGHLAIGWPAKCCRATLRSRWSEFDGPTGRDFISEVKGGYAESRDLVVAKWTAVPMVFPYFPIWTGLAANICLYGVLAGLLAWAGRELRSRRRQRRNACTACGYPRGTSPVCTECGEALPDAATK